MAVTMLWGDALCGRGRALGRMQEDEDAFTDGPMRSAYLLRQMQMRMRPSDVIINTLAKCGQTWLTALLVALKLRGDLSGLTVCVEEAISNEDGERARACIHRRRVGRMR